MLCGGVKSSSRGQSENGWVNWGTDEELVAPLPPLLCQVTAGHSPAVSNSLLFQLSVEFRSATTAVRIPSGSSSAMPDDPVREALLAFATILGALALLGAAATACKDWPACSNARSTIRNPDYITKTPSHFARRLAPPLQFRA